MARPEEFAEISMNGGRYRAWKSCRVEVSIFEIARRFEMTVAEATGRKGPTWATLQIKPGDRAQIFLAGEKAVEGYVTQRQASIAANMHAVLVAGRSLTGDLVKSSVPLKVGSNLRGYTLAAMARSFLAPFNIGLVIDAASQAINKPFAKFGVDPGESVWDSLERLCRFRGVFAHDDENGQLVVTDGQGRSGSDALVEGKNILQGTCLLDDESVVSTLQAIGQRWGSDQAWGDEITQINHIYKNPAATRYGYRLLVNEYSGDTEDTKTRALHELLTLGAMMINACIVVQGWLKADGSLWKIRDLVTVKSPSLLLDIQLAVARVVFEQDDQQGTRTTLTLIRPDMMSSAGVTTGQAGGGLGVFTNSR